MKVKDLCDKIDAIGTDLGKSTYLKSAIKINGYIPFARKTLEAVSLVRASNINEKGEVFLNSPKQYLNNVFALLQLYTDLEINPEDWCSQYDLLNEHGLITQLIELIPANERTEFEVIRDMAYSDFIENEASFRSWLTRKLSSAEQAFLGLVDQLTKRIKEIDWEELKSSAEKVIKENNK